VPKKQKKTNINHDYVPPAVNSQKSQKHPPTTEKTEINAEKKNGCLNQRQLQSRQRRQINMADTVILNFMLNSGAGRQQKRITLIRFCFNAWIGQLFVKLTARDHRKKT
jgi:hypothetical protein